MSLALTILNRQRTRAVETRLLRQVCTSLLKDLLKVESAELGIILVTAPEMARINWQFLQHDGSTDVITFHHAELGPAIHGELFVCVDEAVRQAKRFRTSWQAEIVRYIIHGVLHLLGHDDHRVIDRRRMKRNENRLLRLMTARFPLSHLARKPRLRQ